MSVLMSSTFSVVTITFIVQLAPGRPNESAKRKRTLFLNVWIQDATPFLASSVCGLTTNSRKSFGWGRGQKQVALQWLLAPQHKYSQPGLPRADARTSERPCLIKPCQFNTRMKIFIRQADSGLP